MKLKILSWNIWCSGIYSEIEIENLDFIPSEECLELRFISPNEIDSINAFRNVKELVTLLKAG